MPTPHTFTRTQTPAQAPAVLEALIFDWAGTLVDFGSFAPTQILVDAFAQYGLTLNLKQARENMGTSKWDHIHSLLAMPALQEQFQKNHQRPSKDDDTQDIYDTFLPLQIERVGLLSQAIKGARSTLLWARAQGLKIGSCTGYPRAVMNVLLAHASAQGIETDLTVCADEVSQARPWPAMALENAIRLEVSHVAACVKIDDTVPGIQEGRAAGMWTVGLRLSGNACGLDWQTFQQLSPDELATYREHAERLLLSAAPHYLIDSVADLPAVLQDIQVRLTQGELP